MLKLLAQIQMQKLMRAFSLLLQRKAFPRLPTSPLTRGYTMNSATETKQDAPRLAWVEPKIELLDVHETAVGRRNGGDGSPVGADQQRS
ncbi:MAG: hypothetical protein WDN03_16355 [Rhizomicrobium sp.]